MLEKQSEEEERPSNLIQTNNNSIISEANSLISEKKPTNINIQDQKRIDSAINRGLGIQKEDFIKNGGEAAEEEGEEMEKPEIDPNALYNIYKKIELDLSKKEKNLKEYLVLYIPDTFSKDTITYEFKPVISSVKSKIEKLNDINKHLNYGKINNDSNGVTKFKCFPDHEI